MSMSKTEQRATAPVVQAQQVPWTDDPTVLGWLECYGDHGTVAFKDAAMVTEADANAGRIVDVVIGHQAVIAIPGGGEVRFIAAEKPYAVMVLGGVSYIGAILSKALVVFRKATTDFTRTAESMLARQKARRAEWLAAQAKESKVRPQ